MASRKHVPEPTPLARRTEIAAILARGVLRMHRRAKTAVNSDPQNSPSESENGLELPPETRLSVGTRGFTPRRDGDHA
jgi:hypothetical protein